MKIMRTLFLSLAVATFSFAAQAQSSEAAAKTEKQAAVATAHGHDCLAKADAKTWQTLGLTAEQTKRVEELKTTAASSKVATNEMEQLKGVLTPEQLTKYSEWCKGLAAKPAATQSEKAATPK